MTSINLYLIVFLVNVIAIYSSSTAFPAMISRKYKTVAGMSEMFKRLSGTSLTTREQNRQSSIHCKNAMKLLLNFIIAYNTLDHAYTLVGSSNIDTEALIAPQLKLSEDY